MNRNRKGFADLILIVGIAAIVLVANFAYTKYELAKPPILSGSIQTQLSDTIGTFRTNVNTSLSTLDTEVANITSTQATYGTIVTANSPLPVANGGTGTTTIPTDSQFLSASSTVPTWKTLKVGAGLSLTNTPTSTTITSTGVDTSQNFAFTGNNTHAGSETFSSSTVHNSSTVFNGPTSFNVMPTLATSSPTSSLQAAPKGYVDNGKNTFISIGTFAVSGVSSASYNLSFGSTTVNTGIAQHYLVIVNGNMSSGNNGGGCALSLGVDNTSTIASTPNGDLGMFQYMVGAGAGIQENVGFSWITTQLSSSSHVINLLARSLGGNCNGAGGNVNIQMTVEGIGN